MSVWVRWGSSYSINGNKTLTFGGNKTRWSSLSHGSKTWKHCSEALGMQAQFCCCGSWTGRRACRVAQCTC